MRREMRVHCNAVAGERPDSSFTDTTMTPLSTTMQPLMICFANSALQTSSQFVPSMPSRERGSGPGCSSFKMQERACCHQGASALRPASIWSLYRGALCCSRLWPRQTAIRHASREPFSNGLPRRGITTAWGDTVYFVSPPGGKPHTKAKRDSPTV